MYSCLDSGNSVALSAIFRKCPDAVSSLSEYKFIADKPLLVEIARANDNELFNEVIREWTSVLK